jgi:hypothetical protein
LLSILKIIGIILLAVLILVVLVGAVVLLVPVRYMADASYIEKKAGLLAKVTWLLNAVRFKAELRDKSLVVSLKILGFTLFSTDEEEKRRKRRRKKRQHKKRPDVDRESGENGPDDQKSSAEEPDTDESGTEEPDEREVYRPEDDSYERLEPEDWLLDTQGSDGAGEQDKTAGLKDEDAARPDSDADSKDTASPGAKDDVDDTVKPGSDADGKGTAWAGAESDSKGASRPGADADSKDTARPYTENNGGGGIAGIVQKIRAVIDFFRDPKNDELVSLIIRTVKAVLLHIRPRELEIEAIVGLDDPAETAKIIAIAYMLYPLYNGCIRVEGDFVDECLDGRIHAAGRMRLIVFVFEGLKLYMNKDFRKLLHRFL